ncbi:MAG: hypothetical protein WAK20_05830 [Candidatus Acidiferrum sp.]
MRSASEVTPLVKPICANRRVRRWLFLWLGFISVVVFATPATTLAQCGSCGCPAGQDCYCSEELGYCSCVPGTPIIIDLKGDGFRLTSPAQGVKFDFFLNGPVQISWTAPDADEGWLVLPPSGDGRITNGAEMFGNLTPQPPSLDPNGFEALAVYDQPKNGGNGDGIIDSRDAIFSRLRIWRDSNHNGISEPWELISLQEARIKSISLSYTEEGRIDKWGNRFRYRAKVVATDGADKWAYDVILQFTNSTTESGEKRTNSHPSSNQSARNVGLSSSGQPRAVATGPVRKDFDQNATNSRGRDFTLSADLAFPKALFLWNGG